MTPFFISVMYLGLGAPCGIYAVRCMINQQAGKTSIEDYVVYGFTFFTVWATWPIVLILAGVGAFLKWGLK